MSYSGYLVKIGDYAIPDNFIQFDSYQVEESTLDLDSYRDADGVLHRSALSHTVAKVEFNTPYISNTDFTEIMANIRRNFSNSTEKKASASIYIPEKDAYWTGDVYLSSDVTVKIYKRIDSTTFLYEPTRIAFVGY